MRRSSSLPKDVNQRAAEIVRLSTEDEPSIQSSPISEYLSKIGRKGGLKDGRARAKKLSKKKKQGIAQKAALARWSKRPK